MTISIVSHSLNRMMTYAINKNHRHSCLSLAQACHLR